MGYYSAMAPCIVCSAIFSFNPHKVPSVRVHGVREPICRPCVENANVLRVAKHIQPIPIQPDAYEAVDEDEYPLGND